MKHLILTGMVAALSIQGLSACASKPDFGDQVSDVATDWRKGEAKVKEGKSLIKSGKSRLKSAERDQGAAASNIDRWTEQLKADREAYNGAVAMTGTADDASDATQEAVALKRLSKAVKTSTEKLAAARKKLAQAEKDISSAKTRIAKGERLVREGEAEMKRARRAYKAALD